MKPTLSAAVLFLLIGKPAFPHRLDEYLQNTIISVGRNRVDAQLTLTPGVAVFPALFTGMDSDEDGIIDKSEQRAYAARVLRDLSFKIDGQLLTPQLVSVHFPTLEEMRNGRGEIQIEFATDLPPGGGRRKLTYENYHQIGIAAYQVNCLVSRDPNIRILAQNRNYSQSRYELEFEQGGIPFSSPSLAWLVAFDLPVGTTAFLLVGWLAVLFSHRLRLARTLGSTRSPSHRDGSAIRPQPRFVTRAGHCQFRYPHGRSRSRPPLP